MYRNTVANGLAVAFSESIANLRAPGVAFHGSRIGLRVRKHLSIGGDHRYADVACRRFRYPATKGRGVFRMRRNER